jgi:sigma-54 dependent transcriptional regulator, acetoin dehydrogenase operon transcriptional activator AcoR
LRRSLRAVLGLVIPLPRAGAGVPEGLGALVERAATEVANVLAARLAAREQALLTAYLRQLRKRGSGAVMAINGRTAISNTVALEIVDPRTQPVLAAYAQEARRTGCAIRRELSLVDGVTVEVFVDPVPWGNEFVGSVLALRPMATAKPARRVPSRPGEVGPFADLVGDSLVFGRTVEHARRALERATPTVILGEAGTGKRTMALAIARAWDEDYLCLDEGQLLSPARVAEVETVLAEGGAAVILRVDLATVEAWAAVEKLLVGPRPARLVLTARRLPEPALAALPPSGSMQIEMPSLRARRDDVPALIAAFLAAGDGAQRIGTRLLKTLTETDLPGNVAQLREIVTSAATRCATEEITPDDLTADHRRAVMRTGLPPLQAAEVLQIQDALREAEGNRMRAAEILRIGRSTLYRRLEKYSRLGYEL